MTNDEAKALIREKMESAEKGYSESFAKKEFSKYDLSNSEFENCTYYMGYYRGVQRGLQDALLLIGMLDSEHNRLKSSL